MALTTTAPQPEKEGTLLLVVDEELWAGICRVFFFHTKNTENSHEVLPDHTHDLPFEEINEHHASRVVQIVEQITANGTVELPKKLPEDDTTTAAWLQRLGLVRTTPAIAIAADRCCWSAADSSVMARLEHIKDEVRARFHKDVAAVRYLALQNEIQRLHHHTTANSNNTIGSDLEQGGGTAYQETSQMASEQRDALAQFVKDHDEMLSRPFLHGLYQVLRRQSTNNNGGCCYWDLDDAALVERGQDFAFDAVQLLLVQLRFHLVIHNNEDSNTSSSSPTRVRQYMVDPQLSNRRLQRLLQLLPAFPEKCPTSGTVGELEQEVGQWKRTNVDGAKDASCPQDSILYPILSHCIIL